MTCHVYFSGHVRRFGFYLGKIERAGAWPNIEQLSGANLSALVVEDAQRPATQIAPGRAFDADLELEIVTRRYGGRQVPDIQAGSVRLNREGERG